MELSIDEKREHLSDALMSTDVEAALWHLVDTGLADKIVPELPALRLEQDPIHRHKEGLSHTIAVTAKTPDDLVVRLAALFHDIGKPATRSFKHGGVTFRHHEAVGAKMTKKRLRALEYPEDVVKDVAEIVRLSGRFKGYADDQVGDADELAAGAVYSQHKFRTAATTLLATVLDRYATNPLSPGATFWIPGVKTEIAAKKRRKN